MTAKTLECHRARIDGERGPLLEQLTVVAEGRRVLLVGNFRALCAVCAGQARVVSGTVRVLGVDLASAARQGLVGLSLNDLPFAADWTPERLLAESARLSGYAGAQARQLARTTLAELGLSDVSRRRLGHLDTTTRRAISIAHAALGSPKALVMENPLAGLDEPRSDLLLAVLERAARSAALLIVTEWTRPSAPERTLWSTSDEVLVASRDGLVFVGEPGRLAVDEGRYLVLPLRNVEALETALRARGFETERLSAAGLPRLAVTAGAGDTGSLVEAALRADAPLAEMIPLAWGEAFHSSSGRRKD